MLKRIQQSLDSILTSVYEPKKSVHGFTKSRGIVTNAESHVRKKFILNLDLEDFFGSINFGRVRGMFMAKPYSMPPSVATVLAQICCHENKLPQGAPTSPIISNMICSRLDKELHDTADRYGCIYTRYADDITISCSRASFPPSLAYVSNENGIRRVEVGDKIKAIITNSGFRINDRKTRLLDRSQRQEVTGLTVNRFANIDRKYVRNLRALLHVWRRFGLVHAQKIFEEKYDGKSRFPGKGSPPVVQVAYGRIQHVGAVRGWDDAVYRALRDRFNELSPFKIKVPQEDWLTKTQRSIWVIEDEIGINQGTAFFLEGFGLITNAHCIGGKPFIRNPLAPAKKFPVDVVRKHKVIDLAILRPKQEMVEYDELPPHALSSEVQYGDGVTLLGYPEYAPGKSLSIKQGEVQGFTMKSGIRRFNISCALVTGNSGGPVLNRAKRVIGVAVTGVATLADEMNSTDERGVIPIAALRHLADLG